MTCNGATMWKEQRSVVGVVVRIAAEQEIFSPDAGCLWGPTQSSI